MKITHGIGLVWCPVKFKSFVGDNTRAVLGFSPNEWNDFFSIWVPFWEYAIVRSGDVWYQKMFSIVSPAGRIAELHNTTARCSNKFIFYGQRIEQHMTHSAANPTCHRIDPTLSETHIFRCRCKAGFLDRLRSNPPWNCVAGVTHAEFRLALAHALRHVLHAL